MFCALPWAAIRENVSCWTLTRAREFQPEIPTDRPLAFHFELSRFEAFVMERA